MNKIIIKCFAKAVTMALCLLSQSALDPWVSLSAAHFENLVELTIKVEDQSFNLKIKNVSFNGEQIKLDDPDNFKPRKLISYKLPPGRYMLNWSTEKGVQRWGSDSVAQHEKILVLESGDTSVKISVKGDVATFY